MPGNSRNIYAAARIAAGLTQERAAERLALSVRSLADYEAGSRRPAGDIVVRMADIYDARYLAYQHLRESSEIARRIIPDAGDVDLPESVLQLVDAVYSFADAKYDRRLICIARDGVISAEERPEFDQIVAHLDLIVKSALAVAYNVGGRDDEI